MHSKSLSQIVIGLIILTIGVGFLLEAFGVFRFGSIINVWWPALIIIVGILSFVNSPRNPLWPIALIVFGALLLLRQFDIVNFNVWQIIWPSLIILAGISILSGRSHQRGQPKEYGDDGIDATAIFSGHELRSVSHNFKGGAINAIFGGVELDLRDAKLHEGGATLNVFTAFGGTDIKVPEGWVIKVSGMPIFGGWEDKTRKPQNVKDAPKLTITGTCLFGGMTIKN